MTFCFAVLLCLEISNCYPQTTTEDTIKEMTSKVMIFNPFFFTGKVHLTISFVLQMMVILMAKIDMVEFLNHKQNPKLL